MLGKVLLLLNLTACLYMTGVIWYVQVVHYPLFERIADKDFVAFEQRHQHLTSLVVAPAMLIELAASVALLLRSPAYPLYWVAAALTLVNWASTFFIQVPLHGKLAAGFDLESIRTLITSNWIRTAAWSIRSMVLLWAVGMSLNEQR